MKQAYDYGTYTAGDTTPPTVFTFLRNGVAEDFTGAAISFRMAKPAGENATDYSIGSGISVTNNVVTVAKFPVPDIPGLYQYDLTITYSDGTIRTYVYGNLFVEKGY
jgi:hypothetical protein